ncbi:ATP-binding protein [Corynebacterium glutamicum]|uniref:ATP-binding protein n=2 Tax=Corynebacterium glutamicum TaxID=1718 RepID=UPI000986FF16|nr:ATP-binding protein [Corynebacterium glutamicum]
MSPDLRNFHSSELNDLIFQLIAEPFEQECIEFKSSLNDPEKIGQYISGLSNSAALRQNQRAYLVWGVSDSDHKIIGTTFDDRKEKIKGQALQPWLTSQLRPAPGLVFHHTEIDGKHITLLEVHAASNVPVAFKNISYIRLGSHLKKLADHPSETKQLFRTLDSIPFEHQLAIGGLSASNALNLLETSSYFELQQKAPASDFEFILSTFISDNIIVREDSGSFGITKIGALMFSKDISIFNDLERKAPRVIKYSGSNKIDAEREQVGVRGYAYGFSGLMKYIDEQLPRNEYINEALRKDVSIYPPVAIRELVANALIHQDFSLHGTGPTIEIYSNRIEITNPGSPLINPDRFVDAPPQSRNEKLAQLMRRCHICEERGSGWDRIAASIELYQLPAPSIRVSEGQTIVTLFAPKELSKMDINERTRAVYLHACLRYVEAESINNATVRKRFGLSDRQTAKASNCIKEAIEAELIIPADPSAGRKNMKYNPYWAKSTSSFS